LKKSYLSLITAALLILIMAAATLAGPGRGVQRPYYSGATVHLPFPIQELDDSAGGIRTELLQRIMDYFFVPPYDPTSVSIFIWDLEPGAQDGEAFIASSLVGLGFNAPDVSNDPNPVIPSGTNLLIVCFGYDEGSGTVTLNTTQQLILENFNAAGSEGAKDGCLYIEGTDFAENHGGLNIVDSVLEMTYNTGGGQAVDGVVGTSTALAAGLRFTITNPLVISDVDDTDPSSSAGADTFIIFTPVLDWELLE
jgi:hypothetical protein